MLQISDLSIKFKDKEVLKGLNLNVPTNSVFGFVGKNGAGKTTTMKIILGLLKPDNGKVYVNGEEVSYGYTHTNKYIGFLPDVPEFYSFMTAEEFLKFCAEITEIKKEAINNRIKEVLTLVGLENEKHKIKGFSRGMKQRLGIAQALLNKPKLLICDEPTSALDPIGRKEILDILKSVSSETTVLFSTHILSDVERICTDVAIINDGVIEICGKLNEIKNINPKEEIVLEVENVNDQKKLLEEFSFIVNKDNKLVFLANDNTLYDVLDFISKNKISLTKLEKLEPTLESLFMEVAR
jgi:ABC-2 type transport system ATP-binding protein